MFSGNSRALGISTHVLRALGGAVLLMASGAALAQSTDATPNLPVAQSSSVDAVPSGSAYTPMTMASLQGDGSPVMVMVPSMLPVGPV